MRATRATVVTVAATALTAALALTGCQAAEDAEDAVKDAASDAACSVAQSAVDEVGRQAGKAVDDIGADPQKARQELQSLRDTLAIAEKGVDGDVKQQITDAKNAVDKLLGQAKDAAQGVEVDTSAVDDAKADLDSAIEDVKNVC